ncbi:TPA: hypothetical protein ACH3X1_011608 [Trebouxia sp. C0004]
MVGEARTPAGRSAMLGYIPPEGASEANVTRARALCYLRKNRLRADERQKHAGEDTLEELAKKHDSNPPRRTANRVLHNAEFLVAMILEGEGRHDAIPPEWQQPSAHFEENRKRSREAAFDQQHAQPVVYKLDIMNPDSLSNKIRKATALARKACFDIRLWKGYATSTPAEQDEYLEKWIRRFQKQMSGEPNSSVTAAFSEYEVGLHYTVVCKLST